MATVSGASRLGSALRLASGARCHDECTRSGGGEDRGSFRECEGLTLASGWPPAGLVDLSYFTLPFLRTAFHLFDFGMERHRMQLRLAGNCDKEQGKTDWLRLLGSGTVVSVFSGLAKWGPVFATMALAFGREFPLLASFAIGSLGSCIVVTRCGVWVVLCGVYAFLVDGIFASWPPLVGLPSWLEEAHGSFTKRGTRPRWEGWRARLKLGTARGIHGEQKRRRGGRNNGLTAGTMTVWKAFSTVAGSVKFFFFFCFLCFVFLLGSLGVKAGFGDFSNGHSSNPLRENEENRGEKKQKKLRCWDGFGCWKGVLGWCLFGFSVSTRLPRPVGVPLLTHRTEGA